MSQSGRVSLECASCGSTKFRGEKKKNFKDEDYLTCTNCGYENRYGDMLLTLQKKMMEAAD